MTRRNLNGGNFLKITVTLALVALYFAATTHGSVRIALASIGFITITAFLIVVLLRLLTRD